MAYTMFDYQRTSTICSGCGSKDSKCKSSRTGKIIWHRNKEKGIGFLCKNCYNKQYKRRKEMEGGKEQ